MKRLSLLGAVIAAVAATAAMVMAGPASALTPSITICSFDGSRSVSPFATATGTLGYDTLRAALLNPANFGPGGIVPFTVTIRPGMSTATAANLDGCNVLFTSVFTGATAAEASAIAAAVNNGMVLITDADSDPAEQAAVNTLLAAIGGGRSVGPGLACPNSSSGGTIGTADSQITNGAFGDVRGLSFGTSISAVGVQGAGDVSVVTCPDLVRFGIAHGALSAGSGLVMVGGDPSGYDLFTNPSEFLFNANNLTIYLNAIAGVFVQPTSKDQCKNGGWKNLVDGNGNPFKTQGDCVSYVATKGKNGGNG